MIDPSGPVPVYQQIGKIIVARIESGELRPHRPVPSESFIQQEYGVSRDTARRVHAWLRVEGWAYTVPQRGTYVADRP
jgi:GntR family transcriptional regulator